MNVSQPNRRFLSMLTVACSLSVLCPVLAHADQPQQQAVPGTTTTARGNDLMILDFRDAPIRSMLEVLLKAGKRDYSIDPNVAGTISFRGKDQSVENVLEVVLRSTTVPSSFHEESGVILIQAKGEVKPTLSLSCVAAIVQVPTKLTEVKRRVAGVLFVDNGKTHVGNYIEKLPAYALLDTGMMGYRVVEVGSRVPTGLETDFNRTAGLTVTKITPKGVTLETTVGTKQTIEVPLASAPAGPK